MAADFTGRPVIRPTGAGEVSADHTLDGQHVEPPAFHRAAVGPEHEQMVRTDRLRPREPERGETSEHAPLVRDRRRMHDVER